MSQQTHHLNAFAKLRIGLGALILGVLLLAGATRPALASCGGTTQVGTEAQLNAAIAAFNGAGGSCVFTIELIGDIGVTASVTAIDNSAGGAELVVEGSGHTIDAQGTLNAKVFFIQANTTVTIREITVTGGNTTGSGGSNAPAVIIVGGGTLTLTKSTLTGNQGSFGGAINNNSGTVTIIESTLNNNRATGGFLPLGGAIFNSGTLTIRNSTISGNRSDTRGGGIYNSADGDVILDSVTMSDNEAAGGGGGIATTTDTTVTMRNTIIANSVGGDCLRADGTVNAEYSLIEDGLTCVNGTNTNNKTGDPKLAALANNGGPTLTHALLAGSPALDAGDTTQTTDQRGISRPQGAADDIGAFEGTASHPTALRFTIEAPTVQVSQVTSCSDLRTETFDGFSAGKFFTFGSANILANYQRTGSADDIELKGRSQFGGADQPNVDTKFISTTRSEYRISFSATDYPDGVGYFGFWWSAGDGENELEVTRVDGSVETFSTQSILNSRSLQGSPNCADAGTSTCHFGNPTAAYQGLNAAQAYAFVNIFAEDNPSRIRSIRFIETGPSSFESDNHTVCADLIPRNEQGGADLGGIVVKKVAKPGDGASFSFTITDTVSATSNFNLSNGQSKVISDTVTGTYVVAETSLPGDYTLTDLVCVDGDSGGTASTVDLAARKATINLDPNETVTCTFTNEGPRDYGDAPDTYGTTKAANGAYHDFTNDLRLGLTIDREADGIPTSGADGDDLNLIDDEDALTTPLPPLVSTASSYTLANIPVVNNTLGTAKLLGWLDYNGNGRFDGSEVVITDVPSGATQVTLTWNLGGAAKVGQSYIRLRLMPLARNAVGPGGIGEVEDYPLEIINTGTIVIRKQTVPAGDPLAYTFTDDIAAPNNFTLRDGQSKVFSNVAPGSYQVIEGFTLDAQLTGLRCDDGGSATPSTVDISTLTANVNLDPGETVTCIFTNSLADTVIVEKVTIPAGGEDFDFTDNIEAPNSFSLDHGDQKQFINVPSGKTYTITETNPGPDYDITGIECLVDGTPVAGDVNSGTVDVDLTSPGVRAHCTFTNTARSTLFVVKKTLPAGGPDDVFDFVATGPEGPENITDLGDGMLASIPNAKPGSWTIEETVLSGWDLTNVKCKSATGASKATPDLDNNNVSVDLAPGDRMTCTFTNSKQEHITINKVTVPAGGRGFGFNSGAYTLDDGGSFSVDVGNSPYTVVEDDPAASGYALTDITCTDNQGSPSYTIDVDARQVDFAGITGLVASCTFTNTLMGHVIIEKVTHPDLGTTSFAFDQNIASPSGFSLTNGQSKQFDSVAPGQYTVTEQAPGGDVQLTGLVCFDSDSQGTPSVASPATRTATINVDPGETVRCTFTNVQSNTILIQKYTLPFGDPTEFDFTSDLPNAGSFKLKGVTSPFDVASTKVITGVNPGQPYQITESNPAPGHDLTDILCVDGVSGQVIAGDLDTRQVQFTPEAGHAILCAFLNEARGKIVINKAVQPASATDVFSFTTTITPTMSTDFGLSGDGSKEFTDVKPGQYTVEELAGTADFKLANIRCVDSDGNGTPSTGSAATGRATINLDPGETVTCTFTNAEDDIVLVQKFTDPSGGTGFGFTSTFDAPDDSFTLNDLDVRLITDVTPSVAYTVTESTVAADHDLADAVCFDTFNGAEFDGDLATKSVTFTPQPGHLIYCGFLNEKRGSVTIVKETTPASNAGFNFSLTGQGTAENRTVAPGSPQTIDQLEPGTYKLVEQDPTAAGYVLTNITCVDNDTGGAASTWNVNTRTATIRLDAGENVTCTFANEKAGEIRIRKAVTDGPNGPFVFLHDIDTTFSFELNGGETKTFTNVVPGPYSVLEFLTPSGSGLSNIECKDVVSGGDRTPRAVSSAVEAGSASPWTVDLTLGAVDINVASGQIVECVFTNAEPKMRIVESFLVSRVEEGKVSGEGSIACYWVTLTTAPFGGQVTVNIGQPANGQVTVNKSSVTLTDSNWNNLTLTDASNFVCIRPVDDKIDDGGAQQCRDGNSGMTGNGSLVSNKECGDHTDSIPHSIGSTTVPGLTKIERLLPDGTNTVQDPNIPVLIQDNDTAGVVLTESYGVSDLDEDGTPVPVACYWVTLLSRPTGEVTVTPLPDSQVTVQPSSIVLNHLTWNALGADGNKICIYPKQDSHVEGTANQVCADKKVDLYGAGAVDTQVCGSHLGKVDHAFSSSDPQYNGASVPVSGNGPDFGTGAKVIDVLIRDDDAAGLVFSPAALNVLEGGAAGYSIKLRSEPAASVNVSVQASSVTAAGVDATTLVFTPENWNVAQDVTVTVPDDNDVNGVRTGGISHNVSSGDAAYNGLTGAPVTLPMTITDDDSASAVLSRGSVAVAEGGAGDTYAVRLTIQPSADVVVTIDGGGQVNASPSQLTFTPANWNVEQTVTVNAVDDAVDEGERANATIRHTASSGDASYNGAIIADLLAEVTDNDTAALAVGSTAAARITEGESTSYGLALATQPTGAVQVFVVTDGKTSANPAVLTFDSSNWNVAQTVTLTGVDDDVDNVADVRTSRVNHAAVSGDGAYNGVIDEGLSVEVTDNDVAAIRFSESNVAVAKNGQASYGVSLATRPSAPVVVELKPSSGVTVDAGCAEAGEGVSQCLVFTPENWNVAQALTLTALTDAPEHIDHLAVSADEGYNGLGARLNVNGVETENPVFLPLVME